MLYKGVCQLVAENLDNLSKAEVIPTFPTGGSDDRMQQAQEGETLLKALRRIWDDHVGSMSKLRDILKYMVCISYSSIQSTLDIISSGSSLHQGCRRPRNMGCRIHPVLQAYYKISDKRARLFGHS